MKKLVFALLIATTAIIGCGKKDGSSGGSPVSPYGYGTNCYGGYNNMPASTQYQWRNGQCIDNRTNNNVDPRMCPPPGGSPAIPGNPGYGSNPGYGCGNPGYMPGNPGYMPGMPGYGTPGYGNPGQMPGMTSPECQYLSQPDYYYIYQYFPGTGTYLCVEYTTGMQQNYPYGQPAYYGGGGMGANAGFYGYIQF